MSMTNSVAVIVLITSAALGGVMAAGTPSQVIDTNSASRGALTSQGRTSTVIREMASIRPRPGTGQTAASSACFHRAVVTTSVRSHQGATDLTVFDLAGSVVYSRGTRSAARTGTGAFVSRRR